jgi:heme exporter protein A
MCCSSDLWLLDEVDVNLDEGNRELLFNAIKIKIESGGIVLFSSHYDTKGKPAIDLDYF